MGSTRQPRVQSSANKSSDITTHALSFCVGIGGPTHYYTLGNVQQSSRFPSENMEQRFKIAIGVVALVIFLTVLSLPTVYYIGNGIDGTLFWKGNEAYLFTAESKAGYHFSYLAFPLVLAVQFYWAPSPANKWGCPLVIHVTPTAIERQRGACGDQQVQANFVTPYDDHFYAVCEGATLCKWADHGYVAATEKENKRLDVGVLPAIARENNGMISGWRLHYFPDSGDHFEVRLNDGSVISVGNRAKHLRSYPWVAVDLLRPNQTGQELYNVNGVPRIFSKKGYLTTFPSR